ncbi:IS66 family insertion sequence element accessory protein TnpB [Pantoea sp. Cy-640]|nr:IS66 family insertion sequence element accessory protein TnpB [Pantoea sp. Cy-640]NIG16307.1 IS66 family insertion sequence element accessory protein TnpB [Pantoea sp. Cy-640]
MASLPDANIAKIARENSVDHNLVFKWLRLWQKEGRISRRLPATITPPLRPLLLPVELAADVPEDTHAVPIQNASLNASSCCVEFHHGKITLDNPSPELLAVLLRQLTGRVP